MEAPVPAILAIVCSLAGLSRAAEATLTGRQVMEKARNVNQPDDEITELEMHLTPKGGRTVRRNLRIEYLKGKDGLDRMLIRFSYPRRMKGTGLLTIEQKARSDDQWLYLPSFRRVRRIAADAKAERFVQSDFTYEDLQPEDTDDNTYELLRTEKVDDRLCHIVKGVPKSGSGYARREIAVDAERWLPLRILYFRADGKCCKMQTVGGIRKHGDRFWRPDRVEMTDHERNHTTVFIIKSRAVNQGIDPDHFTERFLQSGR